MRRRNVVIMGAAGRDFHNFNALYRDDPNVEVVAFTAAQIPHIADRRYPPSLAGPHYPDGIPIEDENNLGKLLREQTIDQVDFAYSDVCHDRVMHAASLVLAHGADFALQGPARTMLPASIPVIATSAVRTGCGKSQTTRWLAALLKARGLRVAVIRHPMPYGDLAQQAAQRFESLEDLDRHECTIEEREEYEPHIRAGSVVHAGVDYAKILAEVEAEADIALWDGGNNDFPFVRPDLHIVLVDPLRSGSELTHHPGEAVLRMADVVVIAKVDAAAAVDVQRVTDAIQLLNPRAPLIHGASPVQLESPELVRGKRVLVIDDGPTITHGGMPYGAGFVAAAAAGAAVFVDPRDGAVGEVAEVYGKYPHIGKVLPAIGYSRNQLHDLEQTIESVVADVVVSGTPCDIASLIEVKKPLLRATYEFADVGPGQRLEPIVVDFLAQRSLI